MTRTIQVLAAAAVLTLLTFGAQPVDGAAPAAAPAAARVRPGATAPAAVPSRGDDTVVPRAYPFLPEARSRAGVPRKVRVLVMRVYWQKAPAYPDTKQMKALMKSTATWFKRASRGRHRVASAVTPWMSVAGGAANCGDLYGSTRRSVGAARARGFNAKGFNRFMIVMPQCGTNSQGEMPGRITWIRETTTYRDVLTHELGHNLGLDHANSLICTAGKLRVTQSKKCHAEEYGDLWDAMGLSSRPFSVPVLQRLGWAGKVVTAKGSGTWKLSDSEGGAGIQGLRVRVSSKVSYWLELKTTSVATEKQPGTFAIDGAPGVLIRLDTGRRSLQIVDAAPGLPDPHLYYPDPDFVNVAMPVGSSFTTPQKVRITLLSQDANTATVRVTRGKAASSPDAPTLTSAVGLPSYGGHGVELKVQHGASDNGQVVLGWEVTRYPGGKTTFVHDPGGTAPTLTVDYEGSDAQQWSVRAVNQVGTSQESAKVDEHVPAPVLTVTSPVAGAQVPGPYVHVVVDAQPDPFTGTPLSSMWICLDLSQSNCEYDAAPPWTVDLVAGAGSHVVRVRAIDDDSAEGQATSPAFSVVEAPPTVHIDSPANGSVVPSDTDVLVTATVVPNPATAPVEYVGFTLVDQATGDVMAYGDDFDAPYSAALYVPPGGGSYRIEALATDQWYSSPPAVVTVSSSP